MAFVKVRTEEKKETARKVLSLFFDLDPEGIAAAAGQSQFAGKKELWNEPFEFRTGALRLRPYQQAALQAVVSAFRDGKQSAAISLPTGCGKTIVFLTLARAVVEKGGRVLIIAHRDELILQPIEKLDLVWPEHPSVGVIKEKQFKPDRKIVLASIQTLWRRLEKLKEGFDLVVVDEAHHAAAGTYRKSLERLFELNPDMKVLGVSATFFRKDDLSLREIFEEVVFEYPLLEAISDAYLCGIKYLALKTNTSLDDVRFDYRAGDFSASQLASAINTPERNEFAVESWLKHASDRKTIAFCVDIQHSCDLAEAFKNRGIKAEVISGQTPLSERRRLLKAFARGEIPVITNCMVLTEGFDDPAVDCLLLARPTASKGLYIQMVGRGLRLYPDKQDCLILDLVDNSNRHTLVGIADLDPKVKKKMELEKAVGKAQEGKAFCLDRNTAAELLDKELEQKELFDPNAFHWARGKHGWAASLGNRRTLYIRCIRQGRTQKELYRPFLIEEGTIRPLTIKPVSLDLAFGIANGVLRDQGTELLYQPDAFWRQAPPTRKQKELCEKWGLEVPKTRGEASDLITAFMAEWMFKKFSRNSRVN